MFEFTLRVGTQDPCILRENFLENPYRLPGRFPPGSVVLDVGGHIGTFAVAALFAGAARVVSVEPDPDNLDLLLKNRAAWEQACGRGGQVWEARRAAVWGDLGGGMILCRDEDPGMTATPRALPAEGGVLPWVPLRALLGEYPEVALLKLDCEGAEFPALFDTPDAAFRGVRRVAGEAHWGYPNPGREATERRLVSLGYTVTWGPPEGRPPGHVNLFHAERP
jgi:FkbM family methyltransferase